jgi:hypothetical protein
MTRTLLLLATALSLSGCSSQEEAPEPSRDRRTRGLSVMQVGLFNISSGNSLTSPEVREDNNAGRRVDAKSEIRIR